MASVTSLCDEATTELSSVPTKKRSTFMRTARVSVFALLWGCVHSHPLHPRGARRETGDLGISENITSVYDTDAISLVGRQAGSGKHIRSLEKPELLPVEDRP